MDVYLRPLFPLLRRYYCMRRGVFATFFWWGTYVLEWHRLVSSLHLAPVKSLRYSRSFSSQSKHCSKCSRLLLPPLLAPHSSPQLPQHHLLLIGMIGTAIKAAISGNATRKMHACAMTLMLCLQQIARLSQTPSTVCDPNHPTWTPTSIQQPSIASLTGL